MYIILTAEVKASISHIIFRKIEERYHGNLSMASKYLNIPRTTLREITVNQRITQTSLEKVIPPLFKLSVKDFFHDFGEIILTKSSSESTHDDSNHLQ